MKCLGLSSQTSETKLLLNTEVVTRQRLKIPRKFNEALLDSYFQQEDLNKPQKKKGGEAKSSLVIFVFEQGTIQVWHLETHFPCVRTFAWHQPQEKVSLAKPQKNKAKAV